jgi:antitoxin (DNA-binding transcriptional repressor) of toxin-antitoxin stability system
MSSTADETLPVAVVKRDFSRLLEAAEQGRRTVILRHGRPVATLGPVCAEHPELPLPRRPGGLLALLGAFADWETLDADMAEMVAARQSAVDRPPLNFD